jgi:hypothetical protein
VVLITVLYDGVGVPWLANAVLGEEL